MNKMQSQPSEIIECFAFIDGQNLFRSAQEAFNIPYPNFDPKKLATAVATKMGWECKATHFYTGIPDEKRDPGWHYFWKQKRLAMERDGVLVTTTALRYRKEEIKLGGGTSVTKEIAREKGIDVRIALDVVAGAMEGRCKAIIVFSQDQDLAEAIKEVKRIAKKQNRFIHLVSAFPISESARSKNGIQGTKECYIDWQMYEACKDPRSYPRP